MIERVIVPTERHVERLGPTAETFSSLERRLLAELAPSVALADPVETRLALAKGLAEVAEDDPLLGPLLRLGGDPWCKTLDAVDAAIARLRASGTTARALAILGQARSAGARRARALSRALESLDAELAKADLVDGRLSSRVLADAITAAEASRVASAVGADRVVARWIVEWEALQLGLWRALDARLSSRGGYARIELAGFDLAIDATRERDPLDIVAEDVARGLDDAPMTAIVAAPLGDLRLEGEVSEATRRNVELRCAADAAAQARAVVDAVYGALQSGIAIERIAVGVPRVDDESLEPIRRAFDDAGIAAHDPRARAPGATGAVACALAVLSVGCLEPKEVASLIRSHHVDARRLAQIEDHRAARHALHDLARALEYTRRVQATDAVACLEATARAAHAREPAISAARADLARRIGERLSLATGGTSRQDRITAARTLWADLGLGERVGLGAREVFASDDVPTGIARAELLAVARDAHAWEVLVASLDLYERSAARVGVLGEPIGEDVFAHEIELVLLSGSSSAGAARVGAIRVARLAELAVEPLALLVVIDVNEGSLPGPGATDPLLPDGILTDTGAEGRAALCRARDLASLALAASACDRIVLTYRSRDEQAGLLAPAPLAAWLERGGVPITSWGSSPLPLRPITRHEAALVTLARAPGRASERWPEPARRAEIERIREGFFLDPARLRSAVVGQLSPGPLLRQVIAAETGGADRPLPVTALERFATCAFQGYASQLLGVRESAPPRDLPDAREEGTWMHEALAAALRATADLLAARPRDLPRIQGRASEVVSALFLRDGDSLLRRVAISRVTDAVGAVIAWSVSDTAWDFAYAEQAFGAADAAWAALELSDQATSLRLEGKIDRVDVAHHREGARAIDYKRSRRVTEDVAALGRTHLQVPLYARAISRQLRLAGVAGLYLPIQAKDLEPQHRPSPKFEARFAELTAEDLSGQAPIDAISLELARSVRAGALAPWPDSERACVHCAVSGGCRKPRFAIARDEDAGES